MSTPLPTEEDVLACAVLCAVVNEKPAGAWDLEDMLRRWSGDDSVVRERILPTGVLEIARARRETATWPEVVADSERRYDIERATEAVLLAAEEWRDGATALVADGLESAVDALRAARCR